MYTMLWMQWRKSRWALTATLPSMLVAAALLMACQQAGVKADIVEVLTYAALLVSVAAAVVTILTIHSDADTLQITVPNRIRRLPCASWKIVAALMAYGILAVAAVALAATGLLKLLVETRFTWWVPTAVAAPITTVLLAWSYAQRDTNPKTAVASLVGIIAALVWLAQQSTFTGWAGHANPVLLTLGALGLFYGLGVAAFALNRHGAIPDPALPRILGRKYAAVARHVPRRFHTARQAQRWYEWRQYGWQLPALLAAVLTLYFLGLPLATALFDDYDPNLRHPGDDSLLNILIMLSSIQFISTGLHVAPVVAAVLVGGYMFMKAGYWNAHATFLLTHPVSTRRLAFMRITAVLQSTIVGMAILLAVLLVMQAAMRRAGDPIELVRFIEQGYRGLSPAFHLTVFWAGIALFMWIAVWSFNAGFVFMTALVVCGPPLLILWIQDSTGALQAAQAQDTIDSTLRISSWIVCGVTSAAFIWVFIQSLRERLVTWPVLLAAILVYAAYTYAFLQYTDAYTPMRNRMGNWTRFAPDTFPYPINYPMWFTLSLLPIAPLFTHPWLVSRARHR